MLTCCLRLSLMVKLETPMSYLPPWTPVMIESKFAGSHCTLTPRVWPTALNRSTSIPSTVLPSLARNSFGAYDASVPTTMVPADLIFGGSFAARAADLVSVGAGAELVLVSPLERELLPQPARTRDSPVTAAQRASGAVARRGVMNNSFQGAGP